MTVNATRRVLVLNAGSSSLKFALFDGLERTWRGQVEGIGARPRFMFAGPKARFARELPGATRHAAALGEILGALEGCGAGVGELDACGHRIVHGGARFVAPLLVDDAHLGELNALRALAPLHNSFGLDAVDAIRIAAPTLPQVACFDTAFHAGMPGVAARYALPAELDEAGYRRFGFHGLNFEHVVATLAGRGGGTLPGRLLVFHLGNGCSIAAVRDGHGVGTTMGYSTLDGLVMGTRSGSIDPGVLIALQRDRGMDVKAIEDLLYRRSGLLGRLTARRAAKPELLDADDAASRFAVEHFCYWAARHAGSLAVALGGVDALAFTGGIGAGSAEVRGRIVGHLAWLGLGVEPARNSRGDDDIAAPGSRPIAVVAADEELAIARHVRATLGFAP